jgi:ketosteroid isomerase-like protein
MFVASRLILGALLCTGSGTVAMTVQAADIQTPEDTIRALVRANAEKDMPALSRLMAHDADIISYSVGGRKYIGWPDLERDMQEEFDSATKLDIPITELKVWTKGDIAWFTMEVNYIRTVTRGAEQQRATLPLRETGVLERRNGRWVLLSWHESFQNSGAAVPHADSARTTAVPARTSLTHQDTTPDLSGEWDILEVEDNKTYKATLDRSGNGPYTQQGGRFITTKFEDGLWQGTWHQSGNDREGGFEILLSEDGLSAKGVWWYSRVGDKNNIPPRQWGGTYVWKRIMKPGPATESSFR